MTVNRKRLLKQPDEIGGAETRHAYLLVPDADEVYARAKLCRGGNSFWRSRIKVMVDAVLPVAIRKGIFGMWGHMIHGRASETNFNHDLQERVPIGTGAGKRRGGQLLRGASLEGEREAVRPLSGKISGSP